MSAISGFTYRTTLELYYDILSEANGEASYDQIRDHCNISKMKTLRTILPHLESKGLLTINLYEDNDEHRLSCVKTSEKGKKFLDQMDGIFELFEVPT